MISQYIIQEYRRYVIRQKYGQTLVELELGHKTVIILLVYDKREKACDWEVT